MPALVVLNGERDWQGYLPGIEVHHRQLQTSTWLYTDGALWVLDASGALRVEAVLWRVGAIKPHPHHRAALELVRMAGIPCVNPAGVLLRGYDRLAMLNELRSAGLPVMPCTVAVGEDVLNRLNPDLPAVVKIGNYHGGLGKARPQTESEWADIRDVSFATEDYVTIEPYVDYERDIRCLAVGGEMWAMARRGVSWKVNVQTAEYEVVSVPDELRGYTERAMAHFGADLLGLDFLLQRDGTYVLLESNDTPGFTGFPREVRLAVARRMREKLEGPMGA